MPRNKFQKGNQLAKGNPPNQTSFKKGQFVGKLHPRWKGDKVGYFALHMWVVRQKGKAKVCEHCGITTAKKFEWSNKNHKYRRNLKDWSSLCVSCHRKYDIKKGFLVLPKAFQKGHKGYVKSSGNNSIN